MAEAAAALLLHDAAWRTPCARPRHDPEERFDPLAG